MDGAVDNTLKARLLRVARLGLPFVLGAVAIHLSGIVDTAMMGRYGETELAAVAGSAAVFDIFANFLLAAAVGYQILAARFIGADDPGSLRASLRSSLVLAGGLSLIFIAIIVTIPDTLVGLVLDDAELRSIGAGYIVVRGPSLAAVVAFVLLASPLNSYERPGYAVGATLASTAVNLVLDFLLIYGFGPFPELGAVGNALSTTISWIVAVIYMLIAGATFGLPELLRKQPRRTDYGFETSVVTLSWPAMVSSLLDYVSIAIFFAIVGAIGQAALGGARVAFELMVVVFAFLGAFSAASRILIGRSLGVGDAEASKSFWRVGQLAMLTPAIVVGIVFVAAPTPIASVFTRFEPVIADARTAIALVGLTLPIMALTLGSRSMLIATGRTRQNMYANLGPALLIQLPVSWLLVQAGLGMGGAFAGVVAYWIARFGLTEAFARIAYRHEFASTDADDASPLQVRQI